MKFTKGKALLGIALLIATPVAVADAMSTEGTGGPTSSMTFIVPGSAGGGYDSLARESQQALRANGISGNIQVVNIPGASGTVGLETLVGMEGRDNAVLVVGSAMVGGIEMANSPSTFNDVTPLLSLTTDYPVVALPKDSPYSSVEEFAEAWKENPEGFPIGGGALGNIDHLAALIFAQSIGIDPSRVNYIAYSGGGEVLGSMLSGTVAAGVSGYSEISDQIESGTVRPLAIAAPEGSQEFDMPTFAEQGYDVVVPNWRGLVAPPGITDEERDELVFLIQEMRETNEWKDALERQQWDEQVRMNEDFTSFIDSEVQRTQELLKDIS